MFADSLALPVSWQFQNYVKAWNLGLYRYFGNSLIVSSISLVGILTCSSLLAYGLTKPCDFSPGFRRNDFIGAACLGSAV